MGSASANVLAALARVYVDDLDSAVPLYQAIVGLDESHRFEFRGMRLAKVGSFLLVEGADAEARSHVATIAVRDIDMTAQAIEDADGELLDGPAPGPNGLRLVARHPDGSVIEYVQLG
ncbi:hypothetical protein GCM10028798_26900 [Humibacter antri]